MDTEPAATEEVASTPQVDAVEEVETAPESTSNASEDLGEVAPAEEESSDSSKKLPPNVKEGKSRGWLAYLITTVVLAVFTVLVAWVQGGFTEINVQLCLGHWGDAFCIPGALSIGFGLLVVASNGGTFDMLGYAAKTFFGLFRRNPLERKYGNFYEYRKARREKKRSFWYMVIVGGAYLLVGIVLFVLSSQV